MNSFKKSLLFTLSLFLIFAILVAPFYYLFIDSEMEYYMDKNVRQSLSGKIDVVAVGSSNILCGFDCQVANKQLNCLSYNLAGSMANFEIMEYLLKKELSRNNLKTVIIALSHEEFLIDEKSTKSEGEMYLIPRIDNIKERFCFSIKNIYYKDFITVYSTLANKGYILLQRKIFKTYEPIVKYDNNGQLKRETVNIILPDNEVIKKRGINTYEIVKNSDARKKIENLISLCKKNDAEVIFVTMPFSESYIWSSSLVDLEYYHSIIEIIAHENDCVYIDGNLIKERYHLISDKDSFCDISHLSEIGAQKFTQILCNTIKKVNSGEDVSDMFYSSYNEAIKHFEYYEIYQSMLKEQS